MSFFNFLEHAVNGVATSIAIKQAQGPVEAPSRGGKLKKRRASHDECTPCAAGAEVDAMRKSMRSLSR